LSVKQQQNDKRSRSWFGPFATGLIAGVLLTLSVGEWLREQAEESSTVAHAALEADSARYPARAPAPVQQAPAPAAAPSPAVAPEPEVEPRPAQPSAAEAAAPQVPADAPAAPVEAPAPKPAAAPAPKPPVVQEQAAPAPRAPLPAAAPQPAPAAPVQAQPAKPSAPPPPPVYQDPNSEDAKLAAAAQVRMKGDTKIDNMLDQALTGEKRAAAAPAAPQPTVLPQTPTRDDVVNAMSVIVPAIRGCAQGQSGLAPMSIVVLSDGRVESAALNSGPFQGTASGRCMEGVVRRARFPRFKQANFRVQFPFAVQ
jgi:outer membrane biosynthesis protein TonB